jgi:hypothetical protein
MVAGPNHVAQLMELRETPRLIVMPANSASTPRAPLASDAKLVRYDEFIDAQIRSTRAMVKAVDLASSLVTLAAGVLAFLLAFAVVEHWLVPRGFSPAIRYGLFVLFTAGVGYFAYRRLWPLFHRAINPVYAAQTIEQASPSLKRTRSSRWVLRHRATPCCRRSDLDTLSPIQSRSKLVAG